MPLMREWIRGAGLFVLLTAALASSVQGQSIPPDKADLESGAGAGMAKYAELNGYPGPKHILELQDSLNLEPEQKRAVELIFNHMKREALAKGALIVQREQELEGLFRSKRATEKEVDRRAREIGALRGELRAVHLRAHIKAQAILTSDQIKRYYAIRYGSNPAGHTH
jgi:Spy/CpxP family protein refolding chaperone